MKKPRKPEEIDQEYANKCAVFGDRICRLGETRRELDALERDLLALHDERAKSVEYWEKKNES